MEDEYGYISLKEMSDIEIDLEEKGLGKGKVRVQQIENFKPTPLSEINDINLQRFLSRFEY